MTNPDEDMIPYENPLTFQESITVKLTKLVILKLRLYSELTKTPYSQIARAGIAWLMDNSRVDENGIVHVTPEAMKYIKFASNPSLYEVEGIENFGKELIKQTQENEELEHDETH